MSAQNITPKDKEVLKQIFNQGLFDDDIDSTNFDNSVDTTDNRDRVIDNELDLQAKAIELQAVQEAEKGEFTTSLILCNQAISIAPNRASAYNNRAQVYRLKGDLDGALNDLNKALELSNERGTVACQAFTQRALIKIRNDNKEEAKEDLQKAADLGSGYAKQLLAAMNPYAALCNQMLGEVIDKLRNGES